jgi:hypothetical protein
MLKENSFEKTGQEKIYFLASGKFSFCDLFPFQNN